MEWERGVQRSSTSQGGDDKKEGGKVTKECKKSAKVQGLELDTKAADGIKPEVTDRMDPEWVQPRVVIVGAGLAGLSAAEQLNKYGFNCVTILEAKDRPGGRICSCNMDKVVVECGAQTIYGSSITNPIIPIVSQESVSANNYRKHNGDKMLLFLTECGCIIKENISNKVLQVFGEMMERVKNIYRKPTGEEYSSLKDYIDFFLDAEIPENFNLFDRSDAIKVVNSLIVHLENQWGTEVTNISAKYYGSRVDIPGSNLTFDKGFSNVLKPLMKRMPQCCLHMGKPVRTIKWDVPGGCPRAIVSCCDGEDIPADYVIVTVSLGVLKTQAETLFCPPLPQVKFDCFKHLGYGDINKVFLQYEKPFWLNRESNMRPALSTDENDWLESIGSLEEAPVPNSNVLIATLSGCGAREVESCCDCEVADRLSFLVRSVTGDPTLPYPKTILRTYWSGDSHFSGATSFMSTDSNIGFVMKLSNPVPMSSPTGAPVLFFAGEATSPCYYGTVQGARQSGIREADRIIHLTRLFRGTPPKMEREAVCNE